MPLSEKQLKILAFPYTKNYDAIICDGAVRAGKTTIMTHAAIKDVMDRYNGMRFGICGKTVNSAIQNIIKPYLSLTYPRKYLHYKISWKSTDKILTIKCGERENIFEVFGGKDESSFMLIQGRTLCGVLMDEVALMPQSFVNQALARCSVDGSRLWFNCNPESPNHWFYKEWILKANEKRALHLHFLLEDNPSLSEKVIQRYKTMYSGVFYDRYILGLWCVAEGVIYPCYRDCIVEEAPNEKPSAYCISIDYGTMNATAAILWAKYGSVWYGIREYYYSGRDNQKTKTDDEYVKDLNSWRSDIEGKIKTIVDPSAASFIVALQRSKLYSVIKADNDVLDGIRETDTAMRTGRIKMLSCLKNWANEAASYVWDESHKESGEDKPVKVADHAQDACRYFVKTMRIAKPNEMYVPKVLNML